jgi:hypothetical protein
MCRAGTLLITLEILQSLQQTVLKQNTVYTQNHRLLILSNSNYEKKEKDDFLFSVVMVVFLALGL